MNGLSKADTVELIQGLDLVGTTLCLDFNDRNEKGEGSLPPAVQESVIHILAEIRKRMCASYGLRIDPKESIFGNPSRDHLTPQELADHLLSEMDENGNDEFRF